jgi:nicotinate-nucleotide--dimethylbenzimidazole phosphoribosyltransferase
MVSGSGAVAVTIDLQLMTQGIAPPGKAVPIAVRDHLDDLTKPPGSLGRLEELALRLALIYGDPPPALVRRRIFLFAADHGVARAGVSAYPQEVTAQMCEVLGARRAAIHALARACGARVHAFDVGVAADCPVDGVERHVVRRGTRDFSVEPALTREEVVRAIRVGFTVTMRRLRRTDVVGLGELGIGNTTSAAALTAAFTEAPLEQVVGRGTGIDDARLERKRGVIASALARLPAHADALSILEQVGGLEICALIGCILASARAQRAVLLDGFITSAAALAAVRICPSVRPYLIATHLSAEPGHRHQLSALQLEPLFDLALRLGEGTGAALAFPIVDSAARLLREMATFSGAGVARALEQTA